MITTLRADLTRIATLRSSYVTTVTLLGLVAAIVAGSLTQAGSAGMTTATQLREPLTASTGIMLPVGMALFAAMRVGGEYRYGTMPQRLLAVPRRRPLLAAMMALHGLLGLLVGILGLAVATAIAYPMLAGDGLDMDLTAQTVVAVLYATTAFSLLGVCCAIIFRSQATAILVLVGAFVAEKLLGIFIGDAVTYLPYGSLTPLLRLEGSTVGAGQAAIPLALTTLALVATAAALFTRRDVTP